MNSTTKSIALLISTYLLISCATSLEHVYTEFQPQGWKIGFSEDIRGKGNIVEYVPTNETVQNWSKIMTIQFFEGSSMEPAVAMNRLKGKMQSRCPDVEWNIIEESKVHVLYEWSIVACVGHPSQHEISKFMKGNDGLHRFAYTEKTEKLSESSRKIWIDRVSSSFLRKGDVRVVVQD